MKAQLGVAHDFIEARAALLLGHPSRPFELTLGVAHDFKLFSEDYFSASKACSVKVSEG